MRMGGLWGLWELWGTSLLAIGNLERVLLARCPLPGSHAIACKHMHWCELGGYKLRRVWTGILQGATSCRCHTSLSNHQVYN